jgi:hypothetical protein
MFPEECLPPKKLQEETNNTNNDVQSLLIELINQTNILECIMNHQDTLQGINKHSNLSTIPIPITPTIDYDWIFIFILVSITGLISCFIFIICCK